MRYLSIDVLRTFAIAVMVLVHFCENLAGVTPPFTGLGAPLFAFLSGVSYRLLVAGYERKGRSEEQISKVSVRRGLFLLGLGFAFNVLVWLPEDTFNWDVLTFIGFGLLVLNLARDLPPPVLVLLAAAIAGVAPVLRALVGYDAYWTQGYYEGDLTLHDLFVGWSVAGYFPVFPWLAYPLAGFVVAPRVFDAADSSRQALLAGVGLAAVAALLLALRGLFPDRIAQAFLQGWGMFPATIEYLGGTLGTILVVLVLLHRWLDCRPAAAAGGFWAGLAQQFSRYALTIYVVHHVVHLWPLWLLADRRAGETTQHWGQATSVPTAVALAVGFLLACAACLRRFGRDGRGGLEAWMRWVCD